MRRKALRLIAAKEILDTLRDRRTLFVALILPLLLYPTLLLGLTQIIGTTRVLPFSELGGFLTRGQP